MKTLYRLFGCTNATAAVEAAIFAPIFMVITLGVTDLGSGMFVRMTVNAAAQSGAAYAVINSGSSGVCASLTAACLSGIEQAMDNATGNSSFCAGSACSASFTSCADANGGICFTVSANSSNYPHTPILPSAVYSWAQSTTYSSTVTIRVQ
jgi:hypothetical protein